MNRFLFLIRFYRSRPALCYHSVGDSVMAEKNLHHLSSEVFEQQLKMLSNWGIKVLDIDEFIDAKRSKVIAPYTTVTFDDGYRNIVDGAIPILESRDIRPTIFLNSTLVKGDYFWRDLVRYVVEEKLELEFKEFVLSNGFRFDVDWNDFYRQSKSNKVNSLLLMDLLKDFISSKKVKLKSNYLNLKELVSIKEKVDFGNHTARHSRLSSLNHKQQYDEVIDGQDWLESNLGLTKRYFAIPFGEDTSFNEDTLILLNSLNYDLVLKTNMGQFGQMNPAKSGYHKFIISNRYLPPNIGI